MTNVSTPNRTESLRPVAAMLRSVREKDRAARRTSLVLLALGVLLVAAHFVAQQGLIHEEGRDLILSAGALVMAGVLGRPS